MAKTIRKPKNMAYTLDDGVLCYDIKVCIDNFEYFRVHILYDCHNTPIVSHPMFHKTYMFVKKIKNLASGIKRDIHEYVKRCYMCQISKVEQVNTLRLLQHLIISNSKWESMSMDFIMRLPRNQCGHDRIFMVEYRFNKHIQSLVAKSIRCRP